MASTPRLLAAACGLGMALGAAAIGCVSQGGLPESVGARVVFVPDGRRLLVLPPDKVYAYDLESRKILWERATGGDRRGVAFSPNGAYAVLVEREAPEIRANVLDFHDGSTVRTLSFAENPLSPDRYLRQSGSLFSVSDDGRFLAVGVDEGGERFDLFSLETGEPVFRHEQEGGGFVLSVAFEPGTHRLAAYSSDVHVWVIDGASSGFAISKSFPVAIWPSWTAAGLSLGSERGLELWNSDPPRLVLDKLPAYRVEEYAGKTPFTVKMRADPPPAWSFSDDGTHVAVWTDDELRVHRVSDGEVVFSRKDESHGGGLVSAARWAPGHFRVLLASGDYLDVDLATRKVVRAEGFGAPGSYSKNWLHEGASFEQSYRGTLSPTGKYFDLQERGKPHEIVVLE